MRAYIHAYVHPIHDISDLGLKARTRFGVFVLPLTVGLSIYDFRAVGGLNGLGDLG